MTHERKSCNISTAVYFVFSHNVGSGSVPVSVTKSKPTVKLGKNTLTLNAECSAAGDYASMTLNQADSDLIEEQIFEPAVEKTGIENIDVYYDSEKQTVNAMINGEVAKGTYQFKCTPLFTYSGDDTVNETKAIIIKVKVK